MADLLRLIAWLWGATWLQHVAFIFGAMIFAAIAYSGWVQADNAILLNRELRKRRKP